MNSSSIKILFFGLFKDIIGLKEFELQQVAKIEFSKFLLELQDQLNQFGKIKEFIEDKSLKQPVFIFLNGSVVNNFDNFFVNPGDEVAFLPPVGGG